MNKFDTLYNEVINEHNEQLDESIRLPLYSKLIQLLVTKAVYKTIKSTIGTSTIHNKGIDYNSADIHIKLQKAFVKALDNFKSNDAIIKFFNDTLNPIVELKDKELTKRIDKMKKLSSIKMYNLTDQIQKHIINGTPLLKLAKI